jgi:hypothetical protein
MAVELATNITISVLAAVLFRIHLVLPMTSRFLDVLSHYCDAQNSVAHALRNVKALCKEWEVKQLMSVYKQSGMAGPKGFCESI